ncbi:heterokaryon incompatibility protein-domain-containing protein [Dactylonectria estremocensis]|uniref:Heterokaryon incompatibility protein-domain-containing protein n=1 Tax=Dactylonectria estremocensis TaxID=1079267 RepID=A0A9P9DCP5_9HYPO|nr:heterokaryon incompatibility protein-domain-containing protein [Dactylonectria estremocensis]
MATVISSDFYTALSSDPRSMRIVRLAPSNNFGHISVAAQLTETTWDQYDYEALSYCWGKPDKTKTILLNGEQFRVTEDLHEALHEFSLADTSRALWIDAICINQEDQGEKSSQVQRMKEIYRNAKGVLVWVGKAKDHTDLAFKQAKKLLACTDFDTQQAIWSEPDEWIKALNEIVKRPYWYRAWTVQEVVLAESALLCCGPHTMPFFEFARFLLQQMTRHHVKVGYALSSYLEMIFEMRKASYQDPPAGLFGLAYKLRHRQCTVSHDRVYAFLGLLKSKEILSTGEFSVDYTMDVNKLWMTFAKDTMSRYNTLIPLILAENARSLEARWCYDWSKKAYEPNYHLHERLLFWTGGLDSPDFYPLQSPHHSAADGLPARIRVDMKAPSVITAQGFAISKIIKTGASVNSFLIGFGRPNYVQLFKEWESLVGGPWEDPQMTRKFARTITGGSWSREPEDWREWNTKDYSEKAWSLAWLGKEAFKDHISTTGYEMSRHLELQDTDDHSRYNRIRDDACEGRRIFLLENGDFGLGPESAKVGDNVVILLGSQVPLVLHRRDHSGIRRLVDLENKRKLFKSTWKLVGQAYVHNLMRYQGNLEQDIHNSRVVLEEYLLD